MRKKKLLLVVLLFSVIGLSFIHAQETITTSGNNALGSGGSVSYSIGQIVYTTNNGSNGSVAQGVQQPYEISIVIGIEEANGILLQCSASPNPATYYVKLSVENYKTEKLSYQLYDNTGKLLENKKADGNETIISMENLKPAIYLVKVTDDIKVIKTFKIIKN
ncbi:MAG: T9SS type A sorting domain-containing protein [Bacteroidota bacterium]